MIKKFQDESIQLIEQSLISKIESINSEIEQLSNTISVTEPESNDEFSSDLISIVRQKEEYFLKSKFNENRLRAQRCKRLEYDITNVNKTHMNTQEKILVQELDKIFFRQDLIKKVA